MERKPHTSSAPQDLLGKAMLLLFRRLARKSLLTRTGSDGVPWILYVSWCRLWGERMQLDRGIPGLLLHQRLVTLGHQLRQPILVAQGSSTKQATGMQLTPRTAHMRHSRSIHATHQISCNPAHPVLLPRHAALTLRTSDSSTSASRTSSRAELRDSQA